MPAPTYVLRHRPAAPAPPPVLDASQQAVVDHDGGPLLVLAGPGTGKTTTLVEAVVDRVQRRGVDPEQILVLTFSRKAAAELRVRITARLARTTREPVAMTFHSYAYGLLRREAVLAGGPVPTLLSGPEQDLVVGDLLVGNREAGGAPWPPDLHIALGTRGFTAEVRDAVLRAQERGLDSDWLAAAAEQRGRPEWAALGAFLGQYSGRFDVAPDAALDYAALVRAAARLLDEQDVLARERAARRVVFVDEYQDTDPAQEELLVRLAGDGRDLVVVGDPDQSVYGFRGADPHGLRRFPDRFRHPDGAPADTVALTVCRRSGATLLAASRRIATRLPAVAHLAAHRDLTPADGLDGGTVEIKLFGSATAEAAAVADELRRAHLLGGVPWSRMAVLVRSTLTHGAMLRRALAAAGVPCALPRDEVPLAREAAVRALTLPIRVALDPGLLDEATALELLTGPIAGADAVAVRRLRRALRGLDAAAREAGRPPAPSGSLLVDALLDDRRLIGVRDNVRRPADRLHAVMAAVRDARRSASPEEVLWRAWAACGLDRRWQRGAMAGGVAGAAADRALDAIIALFAAAARFTDRLPGADVDLFLRQLVVQEVPADSLAPASPESDAVRVLTAHAAKGLEWDLVVVAGVQEDRWPDLRLRGSVLGVTELLDVAAGAMPEPTAALAERLREERRLFYVALTRARRRLLVTAVASGDSDGERPSRFLAELDPDVDVDRLTPPPRPLTTAAVVADLRRVAADRGAPADDRQAAAARLARLADAGVASADPATWYPLTELSDDAPLAGADEVVRVSPSQAGGYDSCPLFWLLTRAVGTGEASSTHQTFGSLLHALAALAADDDAADRTTLLRRLDTVWDAVEHEARWVADREYELAVSAIDHFLGWLAARPSGRRTVAVEHRVDVEIDTAGGPARITGQVDRVDRDTAGRGYVVDLKTGGTVDREAAANPQLGVYQHVVRTGGLADLGLAEPGGAELVYVGKAANKSGAVVVGQAALGSDRPDWVDDLLGRVVAGMRGGRFPAIGVPAMCRTCSVKSSCPRWPSGQMVTP